MKLNNSTCYSTRDLKKIFTRIANQELDPEKAKRVYFDIVYSKGSHSGYATVGGTRSTIRLPKPPFKLDHAQVALVIAHEMAHLRGLTHGAAMHSGFAGRKNFPAALDNRCIFLVFLEHA